MEKFKIMALIVRLIFAAEADGLTCRVVSVAIPPRNAAIVDCVGNGRFWTFRVSPGLVAVAAGRTL